MTLIRGVARSKQQAVMWRRKAADTGEANACHNLACGMYEDVPYARDIGHVVGAAGIATSAGVVEGHDIPLDVLTSILHWLQKGGHGMSDHLLGSRNTARNGAKRCINEGCEVVGQLKDFKVCPQCKSARYCGDACQKQDWTTGGHKVTCGTFASKVSRQQSISSSPAHA